MPQKETFKTESLTDFTKSNSKDVTIQQSPLPSPHIECTPKSQSKVHHRQHLSSSPKLPTLVPTTPST